MPLSLLKRFSERLGDTLEGELNARRTVDGVNSSLFPVPTTMMRSRQLIEIIPESRIADHARLA